MNKIIAILFIILIHILPVPGQTVLPVTFGTDTYQISQVDMIEAIGSHAVMDDLLFFNEHFSQNDYSKYREFYYNNSCIIPEEDFKNWRAQIQKDIITPVARYKVNSTTDTLSLIVYTRGSVDSKSYFPLMLQQKNKKWYLLDLRKSEKIMAVRMFLTFVNPGFINEFLTYPQEMKEKYMTSIFTTKNALNGDLLMNAYEARYDPSSKNYNLAQEVFHPISEFPKSVTELISSEIVKVADEYTISSAQKIILQNMSKEGNYNMALSKIAEWSGTSDVIEVADKFHAGLNKAEKSN
ncbi:MAG: hypothetical protein ABJC12_02130 [Saprospiraceae bacterium]